MDLLTVNDKQGAYPGSYYAASITPLNQFAPAKGKLTCDICIIGGGYTGLSSAINLAADGHDVILLDAQRVGFGASGRNGGQVGTGQRLDQIELEKMIGSNGANALWDIGLNAVQYVKKLCAHPLINCTFSPGIIHADHKSKFVSQTHEYVIKLNGEYGYDQIKSLSRDEIQTLVGSKAYYGGDLDLGGGHIHPLRFAIGLAKLAQHSGVRIFENSKVIDISKSGSKVLSTNSSQISARTIILACNGYLGTLNGKVAKKVMPINNFIIATEPLNKELKSSLIRNNYAVADSKFVVNYFRFSEDNRLLFGGSESYGYKFPTNISAAVKKPMLQIYPQLKDTRIEYSWGGTLGITMNRMPHFAEIEDGIISMSGYSGHGVAMATYSGRILADLLKGDGDKFKQLESIPTSSFPGGSHMRSPLLTAAMLWYSFRDKI